MSRQFVVRVRVHSAHDHLSRVVSRRVTASSRNHAKGAAHIEVVSENPGKRTELVDLYEVTPGTWDPIMGPA